MPRQDRRHPSVRTDGSAEHASRLEQEGIELSPPAPETADLTNETARVDHVHPAAETMGNSAAQGMVDEWVSNQHGGPENPDDPEDLWFWQKRTNVDWDFTEDAKLSKKDSRTTEISNGQVASHYDLGTTVGHSNTKNNGKTTRATSHARGGVEHQTKVDGVERTLGVTTNNTGTRVAKDDKKGNLTRSTTGQTDNEVTYRKKGTSGDTTFDNQHKHGLILNYADEKTGTRDPNTRKGYNSIFNGQKKYDKTPSRDVSGSYTADVKNTETVKVDGGSDIKSSAFKGTIAGERSRNGEDVKTGMHAKLAGSSTDTSKRTAEDGSKVSTSRKIYGSAEGKRDGDNDGARTWGKAEIGMAGEKTTTRTSEDGTKVKTTVLGDGSVHGKLDNSRAGNLTKSGGVDLTGGVRRDWDHKGVDGARTKSFAGVKGTLSGDATKRATKDHIEYVGGAEIEAEAGRTIERTTADGKQIADTYGLRGSVGGDVKKPGDKKSGLITIGGDAERVIKGERADGANTTTTFGAGFDGKGTLKDGKRAGDLDGTLSAKHRILHERDDSGLKVTDDFSGKLTGGASTKEGKDGFRNTYDGGLDLGAKRTWDQKTEDGSVKTRLGGKVGGDIKRQELASGIKTTKTGSASVDADRTWTTKTDNGERVVTVDGGVGGKRTVVTGPDGKSHAMNEGKGTLGWTNTNTEKTDAGEFTSEIGAKAEGRVKHGTNAKGEEVRSRGGTLTVDGKRSRTVDNDMGGKTTTTFSGSGDVGGDMGREGDKKTATGEAGLKLGASRTSTGEVDGKKLKNTLSGDLTTRGKGSKDGTGSGSSTLAISAKQEKKWDEDGKSISVVNNQGGSLGGTLARDKDGKLSTTQNVGVNAGTRRKSDWTDAEGVVHSTDTGLSGELGGERDKDGLLKGTGGAKWDTTHKTTTTNDAGDKVVRSVGHSVTGKGDVGQKKKGDGKEITGGGSVDYKRTAKTTTTRTEGDDTISESDISESKAGGAYRKGKGPSVDLSQTWGSSVETKNKNGSVDKSAKELELSGAASKDEKKVGLARTVSNSTKTVSEDGTINESSSKTTGSIGLSSKSGITVGVDDQRVMDKETRKLNDKTTLTTTTGEVKSSADVGIKRDKDGNPIATASAKASATAFAQDVAYDNGKGLKANAGYEVGKAEANAKGTATMNKDGVKVKGNAGAKVVLVGGNAKVEVPAFTWKMLGEPVRVKLTAGVNASVLAEANGEIELDVSKGDNLGVTMGAGGRAFAGAKAGVEVGAHIQWLRHADYSQLLMDFLDDIPAVGRFVDDVPVDIWKQVSGVLIGSGTSDLVIAKAGVFGSAGIGGEASFGLTLQGGRVKVNGDFNGAIGLGGGAKTSLDLDAVDGIRFGGVLAMRGVEWIKEHIAGAGDFMSKAIDTAKQKVDEYLEAEKAEGGFSGAVASAVDWLGDDLFDLW